MKCKPPIFAALWLASTAAIAQEQPRPAFPPPMAHSTTATSIDPKTAYGDKTSPAAPMTNAISSPPKQGNTLLTQAIQSLAQHNSVSAKIRQRVELLDQQLVGTGSYLQGPVESYLLRWELKLRVGDEVSSVLQVCDGNTLWIQTQLPEVTGLQKVDIKRLREKLRNGNQKAATPANPGPPNPPVAAPTLGPGGLSRLLAHLERSFRFTSVQPVQLGRVPMHALRGEWEKDYLIRWLPKQQAAIEAGKPADTSDLMEHLPDHVIVFLGRDDFFPYRIEYRRKTPTLVGKALGKTDEFRTLLVMEFFDVQFNPPLEKTLFTFEKGDLQEIDRTEFYLRDDR